MTKTRFAPGPWEAPRDSEVRRSASARLEQRVHEQQQRIDSAVHEMKQQIRELEVALSALSALANEALEDKP